MTYKEIDFIFPFVVFGYGAVMTLALNTRLIDLAESRLKESVITQFKAHRVLGVACLVIGALWSLQNLLLF